VLAQSLTADKVVIVNNIKPAEAVKPRSQNMKVLLEIEDNIAAHDSFTTSRYIGPVDDEKPDGTQLVYGAAVAASKARNVGNWVGEQISYHQENALVAVLCGTYHTGISANAEFRRLAQNLRKSLAGNYRDTMSGRTAPIVAAIIRGLHGEDLKEVRGGGVANFPQVLRNLAAALEEGANIENAPLTTGRIPKQH